MTFGLDVWDQSPDESEANRPVSPDERDGSRCHPRRSCTHAWEGHCGILDGDQICSQRSVFRPKGSHPQKLQMWNAVLLMRQYSRLLLNFRFRFRFRFDLCASFRGGPVFRDPPCTGTSTGTSRNHFASRCDIFDGFPTFDGGTEADSGPDGNRTIVDLLGAKHAPVARHCHLGRVVDLVVQ
jgi:hypothetical protein